MTGSDPSPETGGRSLAEILREAGIESAARSARRRRGDDTGDTGIRQRGAGPDAEGDARPGYGRRRGDLPDDVPPHPNPRQEPAARGERPSRSERTPRSEPVPRSQPAHRSEPVPRSQPAHRSEPVPRSQPAHRSEPVPRPEVAARAELIARRSGPRDPSTAAIPGLRPSRTPGVPGAGTATDVVPVPEPETTPAGAPERERRTGQRRAGQRRAGRGQGATAVAAEPATGPIPIAEPADLDESDLGPRESALAWLRFIGELVMALGVGVGVYFAFTVLWEMLPYLAVVAAPVVVAGLVGGVGLWRHRQGRDPVGVRLLAVLVFAATLLTVAPAAGLLSGS